MPMRRYRTTPDRLSESIYEYVFGITHIELLLYIALSLFLQVLTLSISTQIPLLISHEIQRNERSISSLLALLQWDDDLKKAVTENRCKIKLLKSSACIFTVHEKDCGWVAKKGLLIRYEGIYDELSCRWKHISSSRVLTKLDSCSFAWSKQGALSFSLLQRDGAPYRISRTVGSLL
jgi:hypothetical protein